MCQPAMAGERILLIRGLMDYIPGISPMSLLKARLTDEGYDSNQCVGVASDPMDRAQLCRGAGPQLAACFAAFSR